MFFLLFFLIIPFPGNGLINEAEFLQWVGRIQALRDEQSQQQQQQEENASKPEDLDDVTEDLIAAFRYVFFIFLFSLLLVLL